MAGKISSILKYADKIPGGKVITKIPGRVSQTIWNYTPRDIKITTAKLRNPMKRGIRKGKQENKPIFNTVIKEYRRIRFNKSEMPALAASAVAMVPIPSPIPIFPIVYGVGKLVYKAPAIIKHIPKLVKKGISLLSK